jgi:hypothetical protein
VGGVQEKGSCVFDFISLVSALTCDSSAFAMPMSCVCVCVCVRVCVCVC